MRQYVVDAFTNSVFHGNQAAVCVLEKWPGEELMMNITRENNFSETAFTVKEGEKWHRRLKNLNKILNFVAPQPFSSCQNI